MNKHDEALKYLQRAMKIKEQVSLDLNTDKSFASTLHEIGRCLLNMNKHDEALKYLQRAMKIQEQVSLDLNTLSARRVSRTHARWCQALFPVTSSRA